MFFSVCVCNGTLMTQMLRMTAVFFFFFSDIAVSIPVFNYFKKKNNDFAIYTLLNDFKKSIDEYKNQTVLNTKEINNAIPVERGTVIATRRNVFFTACRKYGSRRT